MDGQDWETVVFKKKSNKSNNSSNFVKKINEEEIIPIKNVTSTQGKNMMQYRVASGYKTQKALSLATNGKISLSRITELENGKGQAPTGQEKTILFRLLKMKL